MRRIGLAVVLAYSLILAALGGESQQARGLPLIGVLTPAPLDVLTPTSLPGEDPLPAGLRDLGYIDGSNIRLEYRSSSGHDEQFPTLASELVRLKASVIVAATAPAIRAAQHATTTIPIVMVLSSDPVRLGLVKSLARPGGNTTGLASLTFDLSRKRLELLKEAVPKLNHVGVLLNPTNPAVREALSETNIAAQALGVRIEAFEVPEPTALDGAFDAILRARPEALIVVPDPLVAVFAAPIQAFVAKNRLPVMYGVRASVNDGGLMSYGIDFGEHVRSAARYIDKILKGAKPADLPVEQPTKFELVINLKTAKALGLTVPQSILIRADELIQ
jgi:putative ABC transport system substrate-binding protein